MIICGRIPFRDILDEYLQDAYIHLSEIHAGNLEKESVDVLKEEVLSAVASVVIPKLYYRYSSLASTTLGGLDPKSFFNKFKLEIHQELGGGAIAELAEKLVKDHYSDVFRAVSRYTLHFEKQRTMSASPPREQSIRISKSLSDPHVEGGVRVLSSDGISPLVYKPRSVGGESWWVDFCNWSNCELGTQLLGATVFSESDEYGFCSDLSENRRYSRSEIRDYYLSAGELLFWVWLLGIRDVVRSNVVVSNGIMCLIDCETIFYPSENEEHSRNPLKVLGFLPIGQKLLNGEIGYQSGVAPKHGRETAALVCIFDDSRFELMRKSIIPPNSHNIPRNSDGTFEYVDAYVGEVLTGFSNAYSLAADNKSRIHSYISESSADQLLQRLVVRPTVIYGELLIKASMEQSNLLARGTVSELLNKLPVSAAASDIISVDFHKEELDALKRQCIPKYLTSVSRTNGLTQCKQRLLELSNSGKKELLNEISSIFSDIAEN